MVHYSVRTQHTDSGETQSWFSVVEARNICVHYWVTVCWREKTVNVSEPPSLPSSLPLSPSLLT